MASVAPEWALAPHAAIPRGLPVLVCILDGWGENAINDEFNACHAASTPHVDALRAVGASRWRTVRAHGPAVGLPTWDDMGNSEVGHNALGAGQLIDQGARLVDKALADGSIFELDGWKYISSAFKEHTVHFIGLLSSGGVHSRADQLYGCARPRRRAGGGCARCGAAATRRGARAAPAGRRGAAARAARLLGRPCGSSVTAAHAADARAPARTRPRRGSAARLRQDWRQARARAHLARRPRRAGRLQRR
jgi:hypothetical protein